MSEFAINAAKSFAYSQYGINDIFKIIDSTKMTENEKSAKINYIMEKNLLFEPLKLKKLKNKNILHLLAAASARFDPVNKCIKSNETEKRILPKLLTIFKSLPKIKPLVNQPDDTSNKNTPMDIAIGCENREMVKFINEMNIPEVSTPVVLSSVPVSVSPDVYTEDKTDEESISSDILSGSERSSLLYEEEIPVSNSDELRLEQSSSVGPGGPRILSDPSRGSEYLTEKSFDSKNTASTDSGTIITISDIAEREIQAEPDNNQDKTYLSSVRVQIVSLRIIIIDKSLSISEKINLVKRFVQTLSPVYASDGKNFYHYYAIGYVEHIGTGKLSRTKSMILQKPTMVRKHEADFKIIYNFINTYLDDLELDKIMNNDMATVKDNTGMTPWDYVLVISNKSGIVPPSMNLFEASYTTEKTIADEKLEFKKPSTTQISRLFSRRAGKSKQVKKTRKNQKTKRAKKINKAKKHKTHKK